MNKTALIVDDDVYVRELLANICAHAGFESTEAKSGEEGRKHLKAGAFDILFVDVMMPGIGGLEFVKEVLELRPHQKIIVMSGTLREEEMDAGLGGKVYFLPKPFKVSSIRSILLSIT